ncbi:MAG: hypothetical protein HZA94_02860 [Candidatus Vogelbacteria bacterium]|nr:hypothetical protein [Candidatus Vogelbacteria bacterium]
MYYSFVWLGIINQNKEIVIMVKGDTFELIAEELDRLFGEDNWKIFKALALHSQPPIGDPLMDRVYNFFNDNLESPDSQGALVTTLLHMVMNLGYVIAVQRGGPNAPTVPRFPSAIGHKPPESGGDNSPN